MTHNKSAVSTLRQRQQAGLTLVEMLIGMVILGILMAAFTQVFGNSLRASSQLNTRNELISEGQIAQQLIASKLQNASFIYPLGTNLQLTAGGGTTENTVRSGAKQNWQIGTDPIIAMLLPPQTAGTCNNDTSSSCFTFVAYYAMVRSSLIKAAPKSAPDAELNNANAWVIMEYRANIVDNVNRSGSNIGCTYATQYTGLIYCPPLPGTPSGTGYMGDRQGRILVDYIQPLGASPYTSMFTIDAANRFVDINLRLQKVNTGKTLIVPNETSTLKTRVYPRNWF